MSTLRLTLRKPFTPFSWWMFKNKKFGTVLSYFSIQTFHAGPSNIHAVCFSGLSNSAQVLHAAQPNIHSLSPLTSIQTLPVFEDPLLLLSGKGTRLKTGDLDSTLGLMIYYLCNTELVTFLLSCQAIALSNTSQCYFWRSSLGCGVLERAIAWQPRGPDSHWYIKRILS